MVRVAGDYEDPMNGGRSQDRLSSNRLSSKGRILVVEDDPRTAASVLLYLRHAGYEAWQETDGRSALERAASWVPDLVILDVMLPGLDGIELCRALRATGGVPIIMLTARAAEEDRLLGLDSGADDYVTKPFSPRELVARVAAVLRRVKPSGPIIRRGDMEIDSTLRVVRRGGRIVPVTTAEYRLLEVMARSPGRAFTRAELAERAFGQDHDALDRTIDVHVMNLRRKLEPGRSRRSSMIVTVFGTGYRFEAGDGD
jgi:DNA-binding response OmpR family regulator